MPHNTKEIERAVREFTETLLHDYGYVIAQMDIDHLNSTLTTLLQSEQKRIEGEIEALRRTDGLRDSQYQQIFNQAIELALSIVRNNPKV